MRPEQKLREREALETFRRLCPDLGEGSPAEGETPDFIVENEDGVVGIEVVEYFRDGEGGSRGRATGVQRARVLREAERICEAELHGAPALAGVHWTGTDLSKSMVPTVSRSLAELILGGTEECAAWSGHRLPPTLQPYIRKVTREPADGEGGFCGCLSDWVGPSDLQPVLTHKEGKCAACGKRASEVWLLVTAFGEVPEATIGRFERTTGREYESSFDRVYVVDMWPPQRVRRLRLRMRC